LGGSSVFKRQANIARADGIVARARSRALTVPSTCSSNAGFRVPFTGRWRGRVSWRQANAAIQKSTRAEVNLSFSGKGLVVLAPLPDKHFRIVAAMKEALSSLSIADFQTILEERGPENVVIKIHSIVWASRFHLEHRVASCWPAIPHTFTALRAVKG
jgi:hypothetical protein